MPKFNRGVSRRAMLALAGAAAGAGAGLVGGSGRPTNAHPLTPDDPDYRFEEYEARVNRELVFRQVYEWPTLTNPIVYANIANGLNGAVFSYGVPQDRIQVVVQAYASANAATYDDAMWKKYRLGELFNVKDPRTDGPAERNIWYHSQNPDVQAPPQAQSDPYYADTSIQGLIRRGVLFLT